MSAHFAAGAVRLMEAILSHHARTKGRLFIRGQPGVTCRNGFASVQDGAVVLAPVSPEQMSRHRLDCDYEPDAAHPSLDVFWSHVFPPGDKDALVNLIYEFAGTALIGQAPRYERCLIFGGLDGSGKSQAEEIVRAPFPPTALCSLQPHDWGHRFRLAVLVGKLFNVCDEIPESVISAGANFKTVISGQNLTAERKGRDPFDFCPTAGHLFSANELPSVADQSGGFWRRNMVIPYTIRQKGKKHARANIGREIASKELRGIVRELLAGAARVQLRGDYDIPQVVFDAVSRWRDEADVVRAFVRDALVADPKAAIGPQQLYCEFVTWVKSQGQSPVSAKKFWNRLPDTGIASTSKNSKRFYPYRIANDDDPSPGDDLCEPENYEQLMAVLEDAARPDDGTPILRLQDV